MLALQRYKSRQAWRQVKRLKKQLYRRKKVLSTVYDASGFRGVGTVGRAVFGEDYKSASDDQKRMRRYGRFYGQGDYRDWLRYVPRALGAVSGAGYGYLSGGIGGVSSGAASGWNTGADFSRSVGWGDYGPTTGNQLMGSIPPSQIEVNKSNATGDITFENTEFLGNVVVTGSAGQSTGFQIRKYPLNAGLSVTFPFGSQIANCYELYEPCGVIFQYKPLSGEYNTSGQGLGKVILATQYDPDSTDFFSSVQMENYAYANSSKPSLGLVHGVETSPVQRSTKMLYVRNGQSSKDAVLTDIGNFYLATESIPLPAGVTSMTIGEIWVSYCFRLSRPNLFNILSNPVCDYFKFTVSGATLATKMSGIGGSISFVSGTGTITYTFPANLLTGYYMATLFCNGTSANSYIGSQGGTQLTFAVTGGSLVQAPVVAGATPNMMWQNVVSLSTNGISGATIVLVNNVGSLAGFTDVTFMICQVSQGMFSTFSV